MGRFLNTTSSLIRWAGALSVELLAILATICLRPTRFFLQRKWETAPRLKGVPILLVHGYLHDCSAWVYHRHKLLKKGIGPVYTLTLRPTFSSIKSLAEQVAKKVEEIEKLTEEKKICLIGHSMGGLVCSWYAAKMAQDGKVLSVITIGSPLNGTWAAKIGIGKNAREMEVGSPFIEELLKGIQERPSVPFFNIGTQTDQLVIPYLSAFIGKSLDRHYLLNGIGHASLLFSPKVSKKIYEWLSV